MGKPIELYDEVAWEMGDTIGRVIAIQYGPSATVQLHDGRRLSIGLDKLKPIEADTPLNDTGVIPS